MQNDIKYIAFLGEKNLKKDKNKNLPYCKLCFNKLWYPKILFSFDIDAQMVYYCNCKNTAIKIYLEDINAE